MIKLNLYRPIWKTHAIGVDEEPDEECNFTPYKIFTIFSRLNPYIYKLLRKRNKVNGHYLHEGEHENDKIYNITLRGVYNKETEKMDEYLQITEMIPAEPGKNDLVKEEEITLTEEERKKIVKRLNKIYNENPDYVLIHLKTFYSSLPNHFKYPFSWFRSIIEYTGLDSNFKISIHEYSLPSYSPYFIIPNLKETGFVFQSDFGIPSNQESETTFYADFNPFIQKEGIYLKIDGDYQQAYTAVCKFLQDRIEKFYKRGVIVLNKLTDKKFIENWNLVNIDETYTIEEQEKYFLDTGLPAKNIYQANWADKRFAPNIIDFLMKKIEKDPYISFQLPDNLVKRHGIISEINRQFNKPLFVENNMLKVEVNNLDEAQRIADAFDKGLANTNGIVLALEASRMSEIYLYFEYNKEKGLGEAISYPLKDSSIMFSILLKETPLISLDLMRKEMKDFAVNALINTTKISKFKNASPHDIIEEQYS
jgi:hypothetical protein